MTEFIIIYTNDRIIYAGMESTLPKQTYRYNAEYETFTTSEEFEKRLKEIMEGLN